MIPRVLQISNFLSYGESCPPIDFTRHGLICLSGKNGHGKSALLDAITWALWGQARKASGISKPDDGLVRLGQTKMMVMLEFELGDHLYRVRREYYKTYGRPVSSLDLDMLDEVSKRFISLTGRTARETQDKLESILGLDFETFVNSSLLRQGSANEFSRKTPRERKDILSRVLGLGSYDAYQTKAAELSRSLTQENLRLATVQERISRELESCNSIVAALADNEKALVVLGAEETVSRRILEEVLLRQQQLERTAAEHLCQVEQQKLALDKQIFELKTRLHDRRQQLMAESQTIIDKLREKAEQARLALTKLSTESHNNRRIVERLTERAKSVRGQLAVLGPKTSVFRQRQRQLLVSQASYDKRRSYYQLLNQRLGWTVQAEKELPAIAAEIDQCPTCGSSLNQVARRTMVTRVAGRYQFLCHRRQRLTSVLAQLKEAMLVQRKEFELLADGCADGERDSSLFETATLEHARLGDELAEAQQLLTASMASELVARQDVERSMGVVTAAIGDQQKSIESDGELVTINEQIGSLVAARSSMASGTDDAAASALAATAVQLKAAQASLALVLQRRDLLLQTAARLTAERERLDALAKEFSARADDMQRREREADEFMQLSQAFGKNGLQAILIEEAIPELEDGTNELLARLSDGKMQIFIESLRDLRKGGSREVLDIKISDERGVRPYELFSGGEAFRVDFALRVAVSKFLARRAGTSLQTLIIDEGFGSQDEEGLTRLMDAIYVVRDYFSKVIVVSHLPVLKERFPVHYVVEKGPFGSTVTIEERG